MTITANDYLTATRAARRRSGAPVVNWWACAAVSVALNILYFAMWNALFELTSK